jgi:hypothetical protein
MRTLCMVVCLVAVGLFAARSAAGLEIRVAPRTLVLSSGGGQFTVHTDVPFDEDMDVDDVSLAVNGECVDVQTIFPDCRGNLVAQCTKADVAAIIGDFSGNWTTATVALTVDGDSASEDINVRK